MGFITNYVMVQGHCYDVILEKVCIRIDFVLRRKKLRCQILMYREFFIN